METGEQPAPERAVPMVVPRWIQAVTLPLAILGAYALLRAAGPVTLIFVVAALLALLLNPFVALLQQRARFPRGLAVLTVYLALIVIVGGLVAVLADPIGDQAAAFTDAVPGVVDDANRELAELQAWLDDNGIDVEVAAQGQTALETLGARVAEGSGELVSFTREALQIVIEGAIALILIVVLSVYMLLYGQRIGAVVRSIVPRGDGTPGDDYPTRVQRAVFGYVRGQLLFSIIMGTTAGIALWIMGTIGIFPEGKTYALVFGAWFGFAELIPYIGPAIGAAPPVLIALFSGDPLDALWLTIMFTALQQIEGHIVAPAVFSPGPAHQPAARHLRAAHRRPVVRLRGRLPGAAARRGRAGDGGVPARAHGPGAVGHPVGRGAGDRAAQTAAGGGDDRPAVPGVRHAGGRRERLLRRVRDGARRRRRGCGGRLRRAFVARRTGSLPTDDGP